MPNHMLIGVSPKKSCTFAKSKNENVSPTRSDNVTSYPSVNPMALGYISNTFSQKTPSAISAYNTDFHTTYKIFRLCSFNGNEKEPESGFHYYGARYYWSELLTGWLSVDPMSDKYPGISPYTYCAWNPVKLVDLDGREAVDDWVKNKKTGQYEWNDNATSPNNTPNGYSYIGNDDALLNDLNIKTDYETQEDCTSGYSPDRGSNYVGFTRSRNCNDAMIKVSVRAKYDKKNIYL